MEILNKNRLVIANKGNYIDFKRKIENDDIKISRIDGCNIKRVSSLDFDFRFGACKTYQFEIERILFCFASDCHL